ncbi:sialin-like isoform X2 [Bacillus rossius redtenbacheri]
MVSLGLMVQYFLKVAMSVTIVAMVKSNASCAEESREGNASSSSSCSRGEFEWSGSMQGFVLSAFYYGYIATQVLGGWLSDRFGPKYVMGCGVAAGGACMMLAPIAARLSVYALAAVRILTGVFAGMYYPPLQDIFSKWFPPEEHQKCSSMIFASMYVSKVLSMGLSGYLSSYGWELVFYVYGSCTLLWFIPWLFLVHNSPKVHPSITDEERDYITKHSGPWDDGDEKEAARKRMPVPWLAILTSTAVWASILMQTGCNYVSYTMMSELPTYLSNVLHYDVKKSGWVSSLPYVFGGISCLASGNISQWLQEKGYISRLTAYRIFNGICALGSAACLVLVANVRGELAAVGLMACLMLLYNAWGGGSTTNFLDLAMNHVGVCSGIQLTLANSMGVVTAQVAGVLTDGQQTAEQWAKVFYIAAGVVAPPYVFFLVFGSTDEQPWNRPSAPPAPPGEPGQDVSARSKKLSAEQFRDL